MSWKSVGELMVMKTVLKVEKLKKPVGPEWVWEAESRTFCCEKPRSETRSAASASIPPGIPPRSSATSAIFWPPRSSTITRAQSRVCWPADTASERTQPIM